MNQGDEQEYDLCVIGGGINGAGIARDAAGRGLSVLLVEAQDLAAATSSASTKLIHGGLRYLEHFEFGLVRAALKERETLMGMAPHIIWPLRFILPHEKNLRPAWLIRLGLFIYDHLGGRKKLEACKSINFKTHETGKSLKDSYIKGFSYSDCWVNDARMVVLNAQDARERGAVILTRTACVKLEVQAGKWLVHLQNEREQRIIKAKTVINAAGPWVRALLDHSNLSTPHTPQIRLVKGSHIVVNKLFEGEHAYILQQPDKRIIFAIPYEHHYTLIGTTDVDYDGDPEKAHISDEEVQYLCDAINRSFNKQITPGKIIWSYSGVRPLIKDEHQDASSVTRDYKLVLDEGHGAPILSVFGGKITTYRVLAEKAVDMVSEKPGWTKNTPLPGGDIEDGDLYKFIRDKNEQYPFLPPALLERYVTTYGTRMDMIIGNATELSGLGRHLGEHIYENEIRYLIEHEWAITLEDILLRRTKLGLYISENTIKALESYLSAIPKKKGIAV